MAYIRHSITTTPRNALAIFRFCADLHCSVFGSKTSTASKFGGLAVSSAKRSVTPALWPTATPLGPTVQLDDDASDEEDEGDVVVDDNDEMDTWVAAHVDACGTYI